MMWEIPAAWTMEEAAAVPVAYSSTVYYALIVRGAMKPAESVLIHSGCGGVRQAAIAIALSMGCTLFTTVGSQDKREFLRKRFPTLQDRHISNTRDLSFEQHVTRETEGRGELVCFCSQATQAIGGDCCRMVVLTRIYVWILKPK
ncbi:hypothetical protein HPB51_028823 [Rhipicephalus microplus]|uniref:Enoyl reductase (ER) domain-containing protein n=1 Tax=Rhipicephalus microplus TaxID=6941 RepID=A0A9J6CWA0_RHIMP|nr:hypothetical protein HPB51_028823 [Rhipicephalus microplus]